MYVFVGNNVIVGNGERVGIQVGVSVGIKVEVLLLVRVDDSDNVWLEVGVDDCESVDDGDGD